MVRSSELAGQPRAVIPWPVNHLVAVLTLWAGAKSYEEKEVSISIRPVSRWKDEVLQNLLIAGFVDFGLDKMWCTNHEQHQKIT